VQSLIEYRPSSQDLWVKSGDGLPDPAPPLALHRTESGAAFYCVPMVNVIPDSILFNYAGFELGLAFTTTHRPATEWATLSERILQKDKADNN
jgi:hypothetical protein